MKINRCYSLWRLICLGAAISLTAIPLISAWAQSTDEIQTGRYLTIHNRPLAEQMDLLSPIIQVHFLPAIKTVGDAIREVLRFSGYELVEPPQQSQDLQNTLKKQLPFMHRDLGPISLREAIIIILKKKSRIFV